MTLLSSGGMTGQLIRDELRQTGGIITLNDATQRWLTEKPAGSIILPTDYYNKRAFKLTDTFNRSGSAVSSVGGTVDLGIDYPGRAIIIGIMSQASPGSALQTTSVTLGGVAMTLGPGWEDSAQALSHGILWRLAAITGTTAAFVVNYNRGATNTFMRVYSMSNPGAMFSQSSNGAASNSVATSVNVPANGIVFATGEATGALGFNTNWGASILEDTDADVGGNVHYSTAVINRLGVQTGRSIGFTMTGGSATFSTVAAVSFG